MADKLFAWQASHWIEPKLPCLWYMGAVQLQKMFCHLRVNSTSPGLPSSRRRRLGTHGIQIALQLHLSRTNPGFLLPYPLLAMFSRKSSMRVSRLSASCFSVSHKGLV